MWGCLFFSHAPITASGNLENISYMCLGLFTNLGYRWRPVDAMSMMLGILGIVLYFEDQFSPLWYGVPLGSLDGFLNWTFQSTFWYIVKYLVDFKFM